MDGGDFILQIGAVVIVAAGFALAARLLKLPPLIGYLAAGVVLGPLVSHYLPEDNLLKSLNQLGFAVLLFLVGLELDWSRIKPLFKSSLILGLIQIGGSFCIGLILSAVAGLTILTGIYLGLAIAFSSAVVVVKLLSEAKDLNSLHGRLAVSTLLIQDLMAILVLLILSGLSQGSNLNGLEQAGLILIKGLAVFAVVWFMAQAVLPPLFRQIAKNAEVLFICSLAWCFCFAFGVQLLDIPLEIGAFLAGLSLAPLPYSFEILSRVRALRDFFVILLFVGLGSELILPQPIYFALTLTLLIATVIGRPIISFVSLSLTGFRARTAFLTAITQSQLSEFSVIIAAVAVRNSHMPAQLVSSLSFTVICSILISTLLFHSRQQLYSLLTPLLKLVERGHHYHKDLISGGVDPLELRNHVIIIGYHRMGYHILKKLLEMKQEVVVVDFNPDIVHKLREQGIKAIYGDIEDDQILTAAHAQSAAMLICTVPHLEETDYLIKTTQHLNKGVKLIVTAHQVDDALHYYQLGADYVLMPHLLGGEHVGELISHYQNRSLSEFMKQRSEEVKLLSAAKNALYFD